jgi:rhodanese-related sulfurtransferase/glutaredoxin
MRCVILSLLINFAGTVVFGQSASTLNAGDFEKAIADGKQLVLDVRTAMEFRTGYIRNAMQANWNDTIEFGKRLQYIDRNKPVYVYCLGGVRSKAAAEWMKKQGFSNVIELEGGINAWKKEQKPMENAVQEKQLTLEDIGAMVGANATVMLDFGADWCPPCRKMQPVLDSLQKDTSISFQLIRIDAGAQTEIQKSFGITTLPTFIIFKNGRDLWRGEGIIEQAELKKQLK